MPELKTRSGQKAELRVEPTDISFHDLAGDKVRIQVTVRNAGDGRSLPTTMRLESAPLGAFVPWQPLTRLHVPALEPGESIKLSTEVSRPRPAPIGDFNRIPPKRLLTTVNAPDQSSPQSGSSLLAMLGRFRGRRTDGRPTAPSVGKTLLAPDLWDLVGQGQEHWAGNINVFVGSAPVERHLARALRVYPGRINLAMFVVGSPRKPDAYSFQLVGLAEDWKASLHDATNGRSLLVNPAEAAIEEEKWLEAAGNLLVILAARPPEYCQTGNLQVHVTQRSCRKTAVVEFDLDPTAQGAGCFYV